MDMADEEFLEEEHDVSLLSSISTTSDEQEKDKDKTVQEEQAPVIPVPTYTTEELDKLVNFVQRMTILFCLEQKDWTNKISDVIRRWFLEVNELALTIFYDGNTLTACLCFPITPVYDLTYFLREPNQIFTVDGFHDEVTFGTLHEDIDGCLLAILDKVYAPIFFQYHEWSESVISHLNEGLHKFLCYLTELNSKLAGMTVLYVPNTVTTLDPDLASKNRQLIRLLEDVVIYWSNQIRVCLTDKQQLMPHEMLCPVDEYEFWVYRYEVLQGIHIQLDSNDIKNFLEILRKTQSVYIRQIDELSEDINTEMEEAKSNIKYLSLFVHYCQELDKIESLDDAVNILPKIIHIFVYIWRNSEFFNANERITGLFRTLSNQVILFCKDKLKIEHIFDGFPRFGILQCDKAINYCMTYKTIYDLLRREHMERDQTFTWDLDEAMIFNHLNTFIERMFDLIDICESMIVFGRIDESTSIRKPIFGGIRGEEFEQMCEAIRLEFIEGLNNIKAHSKNIILDVHNNRWYDDVIKYRQLIQKLEESTQRLFSNVFMQIWNMESAVESLAILNYFSYRSSLYKIYEERVIMIWQMLNSEIDDVNTRIIQIAEYRPAWLPRYSSIAWNLKINLDRLTWLKNLVQGAEWLPKVPQSEVVLREFETTRVEFEKNIKANFENWVDSLGMDVLSRLNRSLITRSRTHAGLIECNIDPVVLDICEEAKNFEILGFIIPPHILQIYGKAKSIKLTYENVITVCLDYNKIIQDLSSQERQLFKALIAACDKKIQPGLVKLTWGGELSDVYIADCVKHTSELQDFIDIYKRANINIAKICEKFCSVLIMKFPTGSVYELRELIEFMHSYKHATIYKQVKEFNMIISLIGAVYMGFEPYLEKMPYEWLNYIGNFDRMLELSMCVSVKNTLQVMYHTVHGDGTMDPSPILILEVDINEKEIAFEPDLQNVSSRLNSIFTTIIEAIHVFPRILEKLRAPISKHSEPKPFYLIISQDEECQKLQDLINKEMVHIEELLIEYLENWSEYSSIWELDKDEFIKEYEENETPAAAFDADIERYSELANQVAMQETLTTVGFIVVNANKLKNTILNHIDDFQKRLVLLCRKKASDKVSAIYAYMKDNVELIAHIPRSIEEMKKAIGLMDKLNSEAPKIEKGFPELYDIFKVLDKYEVLIPPHIEDMLKNLDQEWQNYLKKVKEVDDTLDSIKEDFRSKLIAEAVQLKVNAKGLLNEFVVNIPKTSQTTPAAALEYFSNMKQHLKELSSIENNLIFNLNIFNINQPENLDMRNLQKEIEAMEDIWNTILNWRNAWDRYKRGNFWKIHIDDMEDTATALFRKLTRLCKQYDWEILDTTRKQVDDFRKTLPLITALKNPAMRSRHWDRVREVVQVTFEESSEQFNLEQIIAMDFQAHSDDIQDISNSATMELQIENGIRAIQEIWKAMTFEISHYKNGVYRITKVDECFELLEEHAVQISTMKATRFVEPFIKEVDFWEKTLSYILETLEQALLVQRQWLYLDQIFEGEDIAKQLPTENVKFKNLSVEWKIITAKMYAAGTALAATHLKEPPYMLKKLEQMNMRLELIQRALEVYLESKRQIFPRFYFISNDEILEILGNARRPDLIQMHLKKLFDNLQKINLRRISGKKIRWEADGMYSEDGEYVTFLRTVYLDGPAEVWLNFIQDHMISTLKDKLRLTRQSLKKNLTNRDKWVAQWPGQLCLTSSLMQWTTDCTRSLLHCKAIDEKKPLKKLKRKQNKVLAKYSEMVRKSLNTQLRLKVNTLITVEIHGRDVIERMYKANCKDVSHFEWFSQLRFYWSREQETCVIRQTNTEHNYMYEYTGNSGRLVITPLTDRCYITLTTALHLYRGGSPKGPAGTGKTETVKDLGKALGIWVVVTNCSEGLDYKSIGKNFSGLSQSGCWGCFDEFNRINIEVLSVVAQQILSILAALKQRATRFIFEAAVINLKPTVGIFITMNPGYAGRTELPDNLKSMFRSISMVVPDTAIIAENILFSDGFQNTKSLSRKVYTLYQLAKQQLSQQNHYDFGLRSMAALLRYAGIKRRQLTNLIEEEVVYLAMKDMNVARLTADDLPLFNGIMADIFPGIRLPDIDYSHFKTAIEDELKANNKQIIFSAVNKVIELYETKNSRHSVMIIGDTGTAKSTTWETLQGAFNRMKAKGQTGWENVYVYPINPKALTDAELYGEYNLSTGEWLDGVISSTMRILCSDETPSQKWILFDGPVDAVWIENMNSVMDDNKVLTLVNSERITMPRQVSLLFEVGDLDQASPATVSRCGMVYFDYNDWGWKPYVRSWLNTQKSKKYVEVLEELFNRHVNKIIEFKKKNCKETVMTVELNNIISLCRLLECLATKENGINPNNDDILENMTRLWFLFCLIWSVGATVDEAGRFKIDAYLREMEGIFPIKDTVYDYYVDPKQKAFVLWEDKLTDAWKYDPALSFYKIIVPTIDTVRYEYLVKTYLDAEFPVMLVGDIGTGKTSMATSVTVGANKDKYSILSINISAQTTSSGLQETIESKTEKRTKEIFVPIGGKKMICFMDDFNMPAKDTYGSQPPLELIRQWIDYKFWYNRKNQQRIYVKQILLMVAMGPPGGGRQVISSRTMSKFSVINITFPSDSTITRIYGTMLKQKFSDFSSEAKQLWKTVTGASISLYEAVTKKMLPTPSKIHYLFNLRDISKVFQGLLRSNKEYHKSKSLVLRLWIHECFRVFSDRLVDQNDLEWFRSQINDTLGGFFETTFNNLCPSKDPPLFGDFLSGYGYYEDLVDLESLRNYITKQLEDYNTLPKTTRIDLVFFKDALEHIIRIVRVISQPRGHMLNIGIGGSGRQALSLLASHISELDNFRIEVTKKYKTPEFREDLKVLYKKVAVKNKPTCFIFNGEQVAEESFLEIFNNLLSTGEINLFKADEFEEIKSEIEPICKKLKIVLTTESMYNYFMHNIRENLHVALCFSPIGDDFRRNIRQYPALINYTTINWFRIWPQEALLEVAIKFLGTCQLAAKLPSREPETRRDSAVKEAELKLRESVALVFSIIHTSVIEMSNTMLLEMKRHNYVTPINYLQLVSGYQELLVKKREQVLSAANRLRNGLFKIAESQDKVEILQFELQKNQVRVRQLQAECDRFVTEIQFQRGETEEQRVAVEARSKLISKEEVVCKTMADQAQLELDAVLPALDQAVKALDALSKKDIAEVKSYGRPPPKVEKVMEAVMILLGKDPTWTEAKKILADPNFLNELRYYNKDNVTDRILKKINVYTTDTELEPEKVGAVSFACKSLMLWIQAIENYGKVWRVVAPKKARLDEALNSLHLKQSMLAEAQRKLEELQSELAKLELELQQKLREQQELEDRANRLRLQLERAETLVESLAGEQQRWHETVASLDIQYINLPGDCLIATAFVAYLGPFDTKYRKLLLDMWSELVVEKQIPCTDDLHLINFICDPLTIREWQIQSLPSDDFSTENGIIITQGRRWPLIIDPQCQAHAWIRNLEKKVGIKVIDFGQLEYIKTLEKALQTGEVVLLQNISETVDTSIIPILKKSFVIQAGQKLIKFNDKFITYNNNFRFYITTKMSNPHYPPEITSKTTLVNFAVKEKGLEAQLLGIIVRKERPALEEQKDNLVITISKSRRILVQLEDDILRLLNETKGSILENDALFYTLQKSRKTSAEVQESLSTAEVTEIEIDLARQGYQPAAERAAILFFILLDMSKIDPMYQFSLNAYIILFTQSIEKSTKHTNLMERILNINEYHTYAVYKYTCRGLFEKHKLLFSIHMCAKILEAAGKLNKVEYDFLLKGGIVLDRQGQQPNPWPGWITDSVWDNVTELDKLPGFYGIIDSFQQNPRSWQEWYATTAPETVPLIGEWKENLTDIQKILVIRCLRPDRMSFCMTSFIVAVLGQKFVEPPVLDLKAVLDESMAQTPLIFVLSPGVDPTSALITLAEQSKMSHKLHSLSLGQGQAPIATKMLMNGVKEGNWVFLANCHLSLSWMPKLDKIVETLQGGRLHKKFRLWLSSSPHPDFPISILQTAIKMTTEPPRGIKANMKRLYNTVTEETFATCGDQCHKYKKLLFALCFFHTILLERKKFQQLGWNVIYSFNDSDFEVSELLLRLYLLEYEETPWGALKYLIAGVNYGGHVTDDWDRRLLTTYINQLYCDAAINTLNFKLSSLSTYYIPRDGTLQSYIDYIKLLPNFDKPEVFGQHPNADITSLIIETRYMFETLLSMQVQTVSSVGETKEEKVLQLAQDLEEKVPFELNYEQTYKRISVKSPLDVVLLQEMERYNKLLKIIKSGLRDLQRGIKGLVVMSIELEDIFNAVFEGKVPHVWLQTYASLKPLGSWSRDLIERVEHFNMWAKLLRQPAIFWLSAFTFPTGFLTAILQTAARTSKIPIDELSWEFNVFVEEDSTVARMIKDSGVFIRGFFLEGAGWNRKAQCLQEPQPMELVCPMPIIHFKPVDNLKKRTRGVYSCPCYYFPERAGSYVIAVDLRVGTESADFWIKRGTALLLSLAT